MSNPLPRLRTLSEGRAMVVTDLHGDWDLYRWYRDHFLRLRARGLADYLIFTGDLIHSEGPAQFDKSLEIVLDVLQLREELKDNLIYLLGNHEMPHLYGVTIQKGDVTYTPRFEAAMGEHRRAIIELFDSLPFFVRTRAGVAICHAGGAAALATPNGQTAILHFSHKETLAKARAMLSPEQLPILREVYARQTQEPYEQAAQRLLAIQGPDDPRFNELLLGSIVSAYIPEFQLLWETLFNKNEYEYGEARYTHILETTLHALSFGFKPQTVLVSGHIVCPNGHKIVAGKQLRVAGGVHARPYDSARYLLFDVSRPVSSVQMLLDDLKSVFG